MNKYFFTLFILSTAIACSPGSEVAKDPVFNTQGIAIDGYDPVAYFQQGEARKGTEQEVLSYQGLDYYFSSTKNKLLFEENPEKYLPKYGGWCSYAVAETATKMEPDPNEWQIQDGELILFTSNIVTKITGSLKDDWNEEPEEYEARADSNWEKMSK